jgi:hypothetical protein
MEKKTDKQADTAARRRILAAGQNTAATAPAEPSAPAAQEKVERKVTPADATRIKQVEFLRQDYLYTAYQGTRPDDLLEPEHFAHVSTQLRPRDRIEAWAHDGTWMAIFVVLESGRNWARTAKLGEYFFTARDTAISQASALDPFKIEYTGPSSLWRIVRRSDNQILHEGEQTEDAALGWLSEHLKAFR